MVKGSKKEKAIQHLLDAYELLQDSLNEEVSLEDEEATNIWFMIKRLGVDPREELLKRLNY